MDNQTFKKLVRDIDGKIKEIHSKEGYTYLDYEFTAMRIIEKLKEEKLINEEERNQLLIKFSNKAKEIYNKARYELSSRNLFIDEFEIFGEEGWREKQRLKELDEFVKAIEEEEKEHIPDIKDIETLREFEEYGDYENELEWENDGASTEEIVDRYYPDEVPLDYADNDPGPSYENNESNEDTENKEDKKRKFTDKDFFGSDDEIPF